MAPELVSGDSPQNVLTDIYSLGYTIKKVFIEIFGDNVHHLKGISSSCMSRLSRNRHKDMIIMPTIYMVLFF